MEALNMERRLREVQKEGTIRKKYYSRYEVAVYLGRTSSFVSRAANDPKNPMPHFRIGSSQLVYAFVLDEVDAWVDKTFRVSKLKS